MNRDPIDATRESPPADGKFMRALRIPGVDRMIAIVAIIPSVYVTYVRFTQGVLTLPRVTAIIAGFLLIGTMVARRPPVRVTTNPWFWLLAFVATYGAVGFGLFVQPGGPLAPAIVTNTIAVLSLSITACARFSLGRNIGFVPAQRRLVSSGVYGYMRHPVYSGYFLALLGLILRAYSPFNLWVVVVLTGLFMYKSVVEENFLKIDPQYAEYMQKVRFRWIPGVA